MCNTGGDTTFQITHMSFPNTKYIILNTKHMIANSKYIIPNTISTFQKTKYSLPDIDTIKARCISSIHRSMCNTGGDKSTSISNSRSHICQIQNTLSQIQNTTLQIPAKVCIERHDSAHGTFQMTHSRWHMCHNKSHWSHCLCGGMKGGSLKEAQVTLCDNVTVTFHHATTLTRHWWWNHRDQDEGL